MEKKNSIDQNRLRGQEPSVEELKGIDRELAWEAKIIEKMTDEGIVIFDDEDDLLDD